MKTMSLLWLSSFIFLTLSCSSVPEKTYSSFDDVMTDEEYMSVIEKNTKEDEKYAGFMAAYQFHATILNKNVREAQTLLRAKDYKWTREVYLAEKQKVDLDLSTRAKFFLSFFSPVNENDNLDSSKTLWKVYLYVNDQRYEGQVGKKPGLLAEIQRLYPYHSRFLTPYHVTFKVPMTEVQKNTARLVITGPIGSSELKFSPID